MQYVCLLCGGLHVGVYGHIDLMNEPVANVSD
jgi:hypothetical protein